MKKYTRSFIYLSIRLSVYWLALSVVVGSIGLLTAAPAFAHSDFGGRSSGCADPANSSLNCSPGAVRTFTDPADAARGPHLHRCVARGSGFVWQDDPSATAESGQCGQIPSVRGPGIWYTQTVPEYAEKVIAPPEEEVLAERYTAFQLNSLLSAFGIQAIGNPLALGPNNSAIAQLGRAIGFMTKNRPAATNQYLAYLGQKAGFVDQAYAQGAGFEALQPIVGVWTGFRNVAYLFTALVLVVVGFLIMLRKKIDPQTVIGIQQALPRLVVTLLLITFSYAIAGLVIDTMYFMIFFVIKTFGSFGLLTDQGNQALQTIRTQSVFTIAFRDIFRTGGSGTTGIIETAADAIGNLVPDLLGTGGIVGAISTLTSFFSQPIAWVVIAVALLFTVFRLFFQLLMAYIQIILATILGPLQLMLNAVPGNNSFSSWIRGLLANAMAFPAAATMFILGAMMLGLTGGSWGVAENIGFQDATRAEALALPLINVSNLDALMALVGLGIILMTPKVVDMTKEFFSTKGLEATAIGEAVGFGRRAPGFALTSGSRGLRFGRAYQEAQRAGIDPNLVFSDPQLFQRIMDAQRGSRVTRILQGVRYGLERKKR